DSPARGKISSGIEHLTIGEESMQRPGFVLPGVVVACLVLVGGSMFVAQAGVKGPRKEPAAKAKARSKARDAGAPGVATGVPRSEDLSASPQGVDAKETITEHRNERGDIVYTISASQFDISPPLRDMAAMTSARCRTARRRSKT